MLEADGTYKSYKYIKLNGVKYYYDSNTGTWFSLINGQKMPQQQFKTEYLNSNDFACRYFKEAKEFSTWFFDSGLADLTPRDAVDENGNSISQDLADNNEYGVTTSVKNNFLSDTKIFNRFNIDGVNSSFNDHRLAVIRYTIEKNLSIAISNYNTFTGGASTGFQMPSLTEEEWAQLLNNMSMISFLQGLSIGGKVYNGYSVVTNNKNKEVVTEDSIYIVGNDNNYHMITDKDIGNNGTVTPIRGYLNTDFERSTIDDQNGSKYFYSRPEMACYGSIVAHTNIETSVTDIKQYLAVNPGVAQAYYTALARERYSSFKSNREYDEYLSQFLD